MPVIKHQEFIQAPIEVCFDLARNVDVHMQTTSYTNERAVGGITQGLMEKGDSVTWEAVHLGVKQRLTSKIIEMEKPHRFVDVMVKGAFHSFIHTHTFEVIHDGTVMTDVFEYKSPLGFIGKMADWLFLKKYMTELIVGRARVLKEIAEDREFEKRQ